MNISTACNKAQKWLPPITEQDKIIINNILLGTDNTFGIHLLRQYIKLLKPYTELLNINKPREADCLASGLIFFYGCLIYIMHFSHWGNHIEDIFLYNLLYILVDHYIDDMTIDAKSKTLAISQMSHLIINPLAHETMPLIDPVLKTIAIIYHRLLTRCPQIQEPLIKLFYAEIEGFTIQNTPSLPRQVYYDICLKKGGYTMQALQNIINNTDPCITQAAFHIGTIMQLIDDCLDVLSDKNNGIHTIATHDLEKFGTLDNLWLDIIQRILSIDRKFTIFIILYTFFAVYIPDRHPENYSHKLRSRTNSMNLFDRCDASVLLVNIIIHELSIID